MGGAHFGGDGILHLAVLSETGSRLGSTCSHPVTHLLAQQHQLPLSCWQRGDSESQLQHAAAACSVGTDFGCILYHLKTDRHLRLYHRTLCRIRRHLPVGRIHAPQGIRQPAKRQGQGLRPRVARPFQIRFPQPDRPFRAILQPALKLLSTEQIHQRGSRGCVLQRCLPRRSHLDYQQQHRLGAICPHSQRRRPRLCSKTHVGLE